MTYYVTPAMLDGINAKVAALTGKDEASASTIRDVVFAEVGAYINSDIMVAEDETPILPQNIVGAVIIPMMAARMVEGVQGVTTVSEGGSSATFQTNMSAKVEDYYRQLTPYRRLRVPMKGATA